MDIRLGDQDIGTWRLEVNESLIIDECPYSDKKLSMSEVTAILRLTFRPEKIAGGAIDHNTIVWKKTSELFYTQAIDKSNVDWKRASSIIVKLTAT